MRRHLRTGVLAALAAGALVAAAAVAGADQFIGIDDDVIGDPLDFGLVCPGQQVSDSVDLRVLHNGTNWFDNGAVVTVTPGTPSDPQLSAAPVASITLPSDWTSLPVDGPTIDRVSDPSPAGITLTVDGAATNGAKSGTIDYTAQGKKFDSPTNIQRTFTQSVLWTVNQTYGADFLPPFDDSSPSSLIVNKMKNGRVVPVKIAIFDDCTQSYVTSGSVTINVSKTSGGGTSDPVESYADAGSSSAGTDEFRWSPDATAPGGGYWVYNLDSKALGLVVGNAYRVDVSVDGTQATAGTWAVLQPTK